MSSWFIGREDWEGDNGISVAMEDDDDDDDDDDDADDDDADADADADAEAGEYACDFLKVALRRL
jgi:hypothetical protein